jgi:hypothetical protein
MEVTSLAWTQCGRLDNPQKSSFKHAFSIIIIWKLKVCGTLNYNFKDLDLFSHRKRPTTKSLKFMLCASCEAVMLVWSNIYCLAKLGKKMWYFFCWEEISVARVPRCFDNYNMNEWVGYGVWHFSCTDCTRCGCWYLPLPYIQYLIFLWWGEALK